MKRPLFPMIIILSMILSISGPFLPVQANSHVLLPDFDQDGIPSPLQSAGWYNLAGGPFLTSPDDPDSDNDGLTDWQELYTYSTDPVDPDSDNDLITDGYEVDYGLDPNDPSDAAENWDSDTLKFSFKLDLDEFRKRHANLE